MDNTEYAGFWVRTGAALIDCAILMLILSIPLSLIYGPAYWLEDRLIFGFWDFILTYILPFLATIWFWLKFFATPGKMATRLEILDADTGTPITSGQAIIRYLAYFPSFLIFGLGIIWVGVDKRKQGWHDKIANTVVIRKLEGEPVEFGSRY